MKYFWKFNDNSFEMEFVRKTRCYMVFRYPIPGNDVWRMSHSTYQYYVDVGVITETEEMTDAEIDEAVINKSHVDATNINMARMNPTTHILQGSDS